jgi:hypothetical protein
MDESHEKNFGRLDWQRRELGTFMVPPSSRPVMSELLNWKCPLTSHPLVTP